MPVIDDQIFSAVINPIRIQYIFCPARILVLGVAYKQDIDDYRESPAIRVIEELEKEQALVDYYDPWIPQYREKGKTVKGLPELTPQVVSSYDLVVITTAHTNLDYQMVQQNARAIFDTKNVMKQIQPRDNIEVL